ncbi:hypothetical protein ACN6LM_002233 [Streptomyces sp. SAS_281]|uniref:hypothetical protein n=1 Tax=Streptomyces sp. SAS_281 TaxID=3412744 RepID=UPI00403C63BE
MISIEEAVDVATRFVERNWDGWDPMTMRIVREDVRVEGSDVVVPYDLRDATHVEGDGNFLLGNLPVLVDVSRGTCRFMTIDELLASPGFQDSE